MCFPVKRLATAWSRAQKLPDLSLDFLLKYHAYSNILGSTALWSGLHKKLYNTHETDENTKNFFASSSDNMGTAEEVLMRQVETVR